MIFPVNLATVISYCNQRKNKILFFSQKWDILLLCLAWGMSSLQWPSEVDSVSGTSRFMLAPRGQFLHSLVYISADLEM